MNPFKREDNPVIANVKQYAGNYRGTVDGLMCWEIRNPQEEPFKGILEAACQTLSQCHSIPRSTLVLIDVFLRGSTLESSTAYVILAGSTETHRKTALKHLRRSPLLRQYTGLKVDQWDWPPHAPNITMTGKKGETSDVNLLYACPKFNIRRLVSGNAEDADNTPNGSLLSITATNEDQEIPRAGTLSCVIMVGEDDFFVAPAHIFMPHPPEETGDDVEDSESDYGSEMLRAGSATPPSLRSDSPTSKDSKGTTDDIAQKSLSSSWDSFEGSVERLNLMQPSAATEAYEVFSLEHDYTLIPIPQGETFHQALRRISPEIVERINAGRFAVSVMTPSRGPMNGWLDGRPTLMRLPYGNKFVKFYPISFPDAVSEGDCGSLVINRDTKQIYGFIVAASIEGRMAYIVSAEEVLQDITARLGKKCCSGQPLYGESSVRSPTIAENGSEAVRLSLEEGTNIESETAVSGGASKSTSSPRAPGGGSLSALSGVPRLRPVSPNLDPDFCFPICPRVDPAFTAKSQQNIPPLGATTHLGSLHYADSTPASSANPGENWTNISDLAERRRVQNRIAQRNYRMWPALPHVAPSYMLTHPRKET